MRAPPSVMGPSATRPPCGGRAAAPLHIWVAPKGRFRFTFEIMNTENYTATAQELGAIFTLTARRVRQYVEDGDMRPLERGRFDAAWFGYLLAGRRMTANRPRKVPPHTCVALAWRAVTSGTAAERDALVKLFIRNGLTHDDALVALGSAEGLRA